MYLKGSGQNTNLPWQKQKTLHFQKYITELRSYDSITGHNAEIKRCLGTPSSMDKSASQLSTCGSGNIMEEGWKDCKCPNTRNSEIVSPRSGFIDKDRTTAIYMGILTLKRKFYPGALP